MTDDEVEHLKPGEDDEEQKRCTPCQIAFWVIGGVVAAALLGLAIWGIVVLCTPNPHEPAAEKPGSPRPGPKPGPLPIQYKLHTTTPPQPALLAEILQDNVGAGSANFANNANVRAADLYNFSQCSNTCYLAAAFSSLLRTPAARKYLDETFCPALRNNFALPDQKAIDTYGRWRYGLPHAFCQLWDSYKTENKVASDRDYQAWKNRFYQKGGPLRLGDMDDVDEAFKKSLYMLAVPRALNKKDGQFLAGAGTASGAGFKQLDGQERKDFSPGVDFMPPTPAFPPNGFHAEFSGTEFMGDLRTVELVILKGHGDHLDANEPTSWRNSKCIRQAHHSGQPETEFRYQPDVDTHNKRGILNVQTVLGEFFTHASVPDDVVMRAWSQEPLENSPDQCRDDNGQGQVRAKQLVNLPKSGLLPVFINRTFWNAEGIRFRNNVRVQVPLIVEVKRDWFAEAVEEGHKPGKGKDWEYSLRSFACHSGDNMDGGHWYAYAKVGKNWFQLNNSYDVHAQAVEGGIRDLLKREEQNIVQLFYERVK